MSPSPTTPTIHPSRRITPSVAARAGHAFPTHAVMQGFACHARGVEVTEATRGRVRARVRSKRVHDVELRAEGGRLLLACSCPSAALGVPGCKHAWATLLEVDRRGGLEDLRERHGELRVDGASPTTKHPHPDAAPEQDLTKQPRPPRSKEPDAAARKKPRPTPPSSPASPSKAKTKTEKTKLEPEKTKPEKTKPEKTKPEKTKPEPEKTKPEKSKSDPRTESLRAARRR